VNHHDIKVPFVSVSSRFGNRVKRLADLLIAATLIVLALPLMGFIALAIKCDSSGPVFDREERDGPFVALRFRTTLHVGARDTRPVRTTEPERQLTRLGWFLRDTRLDRLPQLINVVRGDMSVIPASPERPYYLD
jgi:lipopolysaccharide/colanic/teichoic acid biosynthesis glycosyltransferase